MNQQPNQERYEKAKSLLRMMRHMSQTFGQDSITIATDFFLEEEEDAANLAIQLHKENASVHEVQFNEERGKYTVKSSAENLNLHNQDTIRWLERLLQLAEKYNCTFRSTSPDFDIQLF